MAGWQQGDVEWRRGNAGDEGSKGVESEGEEVMRTGWRGKRVAEGERHEEGTEGRRREGRKERKMART